MNNEEPQFIGNNPTENERHEPIPETSRNPKSPQDIPEFPRIPQKLPKTTQKLMHNQQKKLLIQEVKSITYAQIPTLTTQTHTDIKKKTSRERPKSARYLKLKKTRKRKPLFLQLETTKTFKKLKIETKFEFFSGIFSKFPVSRRVPKKCKRGDALRFFEHPFCCKILKMDGRNNKKIRKKINLTVPKKEESLIVSKRVDPSALKCFFSHVRGFGCVENEVLSTYGKVW